MEFEEIYQQMADKYAELAGFLPDDASDAGIRLRVLAGEIYAALCQIENVRRISFPQTAAGEALEMHAAQRGLTRKTAQRAVGTLTFSRKTALTYDIEIPAGTVCASSGETAEYETTASALLTAGTLSVTTAAAAVAGGKAFNAAVNTVDTMVVPPAGIESVTNGTPFTGGTDAEDDAALRDRLLRCFSVLPNGTNTETYRRAVLQVAGVGSAGIVPQVNGIGTVGVYLYGDKDAVSADVVQAVQAMLDAMREINVTVTVAAAEAIPRNIVSYIVPRENCTFDEAKTRCTAAIQAAMGRLQVGEPFVCATLTAAMMQTGTIQNCTLGASMADYATAEDEIVTAGTITLVEQ